MTIAERINNIKADNSTKEAFKATRREWLRGTLALLSFSLLGLSFPPAYLFVALVLFESFRKDRYDFLIQCFYFFGGFAFFRVNELPVGPPDIALGLSFLFMILYRRRGVVNRLTIGTMLYIIFLVFMATLSEETMSIQFRKMRGYFMMVCFILPLAMFSGRDFDIKEFFRKLIMYQLIIAAFYVIDCYVLNGHVLLPAILAGRDWGQVASTWTQLDMYPLSFYLPRIYPQSLFFMALAVYPLMRYYRLNKWQWLLILLAFAACRTMTVIAGVIAAWLLFQGRIMRVIRYTFFALICLVGIYFVDVALGGFLRVESTVNQFVSLDEGMDEEDLAEFGTGRMAQIIPKMALLYELDREWIGFGFLHKELTTMTKYQIYNELYINTEHAEEVATDVEEGQIQTILDIGYIGLIVQTFFFVWIYFVIKRMRYSLLYLGVLVANLVYSVGGFAGLYVAQGLLLQGLTLGVILLANREGYPSSPKPDEEETDKDSEPVSDEPEILPETSLTAR